jgi:hypothetical protein
VHSSKKRTTHDRITPPKWRRGSAIVDAILEFQHEPWIKLLLGGDELAEVRPGGIALLTGGTGSGKSSLAASLLVEHARHVGPAIAASLELPLDEFGARAIGLQRETSWKNVFQGRLARSEMESALPPRFAILERSHATIVNLEALITELRREYPGEPVLAAVDYVQLVTSSETEIRRRVADAMVQIDRVARGCRIVVIALSQGSRASSRALASGEKIGAETADAGAEASELERWSSITVAIGTKGQAADDGSCAVELSLGKTRMGAGDAVIPARYWGLSGRWRLAGAPRPASEVRAERVSERDAEKRSAAELAIAAAAERATEPMTRDDLGAKASTKATIARAAITNLIDRGELVEVRSKKPRAKAWKVWTRARAEAAGIAIVADSEGS